ncbi:60S ribosomal protein L22 [Porphyridium purpureum]|uniref:Large ribosomal subunit protein eL22 n=1 Tax=Porphyridium purpureum TaxID=35688 RepID=A0A5J4Z5Q4_PORPP|nr:60S ribosomal protein L22 [Porphyridium purpureum]|eukprot:POR2462..scf295_1
MPFIPFVHGAQQSCEIARLLGGSRVKKMRKQKKVTKTFTVNCQTPVQDGIMDVASFEKFLNDKIKVNGKPGALGESVVVSRDKTNVTVTANIDFSKRYLKYLTKKYLKKNMIREYLRVLAVDATTFELRYPHIEDDEEEEAEE